MDICVCRVTITMQAHHIGIVLCVFHVVTITRTYRTGTDHNALKNALSINRTGMELTALSVKTMTCTNRYGMALNVSHAMTIIHTKSTGTDLSALTTVLGHDHIMLIMCVFINVLKIGHIRYLENVCHVLT